MAFNIQEVISEVAKKGVQRNNKFKVQFPIVPAFSANKVGNLGELKSTNRSLEFWCEECNIPGAGLMTADIRRYGYGPVEKKPFAPAFTDVQMVLRCDAKGLMHSYLHNWLRVAVCYQAGAQGVLMPNRAVGPVQNQFLWEVGYKTDYAVPVEIRAYDDAGHTSMVITLTEAYPIFVGDIPLSWASRGEYARLPVTMTFFDWSTFSPEAKIAIGSENTTKTPSSTPVVVTV